jgi:hypothetical protein
VRCRGEKLVAEAGDSSGTRGRGTSALESRYQETASEDCNTEYTCLCVTVICKV